MPPAGWCGCCYEERDPQLWQCGVSGSSIGAACLHLHELATCYKMRRHDADHVVVIVDDVGCLQ